MISSIVYTLTSIDDVKGVILYVEGEILTCLPSGRFLPSLLDRSYGVNRIYDIENYKNVESVNIYYISKNTKNTKKEGIPQYTFFLFTLFK